MSYDITLKDPVTNEAAEVPVHLMISGTYKADYEIEVDEGDTPNYWNATAANSIWPLNQLIALARMRPDGICDGD